MGVLLGSWTTVELRDAIASETPVVALVPVGSVEPHGPHLPLATDAIISETASTRAAARLASAGLCAVVAPGVGYGVTNFAAGFAGAVSVPPEVLTAFLRAVVRGYLDNGFSHVCLVNNHLEPEHDTAVRAAIEGFAKTAASVACPLTRRWARTLSDEFKSGACHAGRYETSLVLAAGDGAESDAGWRTLPAIDVSLSEGIRAGKKSFAEMGLDRAYTGAPGEASRAEGDALYDKLATMIATEVLEALGRAEKDTKS